MAAMNVTADAPAASPSMKRTTLSGCWKLDKTRGTPSMRGYLETMGVNEMAIEAHEKGESEHDTIHTITIDGQHLKIVKRSRVNNDLKVDLEFGKESVETMSGGRVKKMLATSDNPQHVDIRSSLNTMNGMALVTDVKRLQQEEGEKSVLIQELSVINEQTGNEHLTKRYFIPYTDTPPHLVPDPMQIS
mmetsp:Transcript_5453/g.8010  ORF Transcript_5453/g.8010 Transcript_5453/m.8010 type:complete len:189 (+) Transcript_5453:101-667(+)